ncbi:MULTISPECIES: hypothetical protein [unclassified Moorena]|nr:MULTISPECIES: hypothetical protein [unclassified Moorena]
MLLWLIGSRESGVGSRESGVGSRELLIKNYNNSFSKSPFLRGI